MDHTVWWSCIKSLLKRMNFTKRTAVAHQIFDEVKPFLVDILKEALHNYTVVMEWPASSSHTLISLRC